VISSFFEHDSAFPQITFCEIDKFAKNSALQFQRNQGWVDYNQSKVHFGIFSGYNKYLLESNVAFGSMLDTLNDSSRKQFFTSINETIISCMFNSKICRCEQFSYFSHPVFGACIRFKAHERIKSAGANNGLKIDLLLEPVNKKNYLINSRGVAIMIENETAIFETFPTAHTTVGKRTNIDVKRVFRTFLPEPYSKCVQSNQKHDSNLYNLILSLNLTYTQTFV